MSHNHNHETAVCKHTCLHYCPGCGKVYCCACGREWGNSYGNYIPYYPYYPGTTNPWIVTCGNVTTDDTKDPTVQVTYTCSHEH